MKTKIMRYRVMALSLALFLSSTFSFSASATNSNDSAAVQLRFIGNLNKQPVFELNLDNIDQDEYYITISDEEGTLLYFDKIRSKNFSRKFQVNTDEIQGDLRVEVKSKKNNKTEVYRINSVTRFVQETFVTKL